MITISNSGPQIGLGDLTDIEAAVGTKLPASYKSFLLRNNGGIPSPDTIDIDPAPGSPTDVQVFFGIGRIVKSSDLTWNAKIMSDRLATDCMLPIASDSGGNFFCLDIRGAVIYCDIYGVLPHTYEVAPNFDAFLAKIRPWQQ